MFCCGAEAVISWNETAFQCVLVFFFSEMDSELEAKMTAAIQSGDHLWHVRGLFRNHRNYDKHYVALSPIEWLNAVRRIIARGVGQHDLHYYFPMEHYLCRPWHHDSKCVEVLLAEGADLSWHRMCVSVCDFFPQLLHVPMVDTLRRLIVAGLNPQVVLERLQMGVYQEALPDWERIDEDALCRVRRCVDVLLSFGGIIDVNKYASEREDRKVTLHLENTLKFAYRGRYGYKEVPLNPVVLLDDPLRLRHICRKVVRAHLMSISSISLFYRVPHLGLPKMITDFLLYGEKLRSYVEGEHDEKGQEKTGQERNDRERKEIQEGKRQKKEGKTKEEEQGEAAERNSPENTDEDANSASKEPKKEPERNETAVKSRGMEKENAKELKTKDENSTEHVRKQLKRKANETRTEEETQEREKREVPQRRLPKRKATELKIIETELNEKKKTEKQELKPERRAMKRQTNVVKTAGQEGKNEPEKQELKGKEPSLKKKAKEMKGEEPSKKRRKEPKRKTSQIEERRRKKTTAVKPQRVSRWCRLSTVRRSLNEKQVNKF